MSFRTAARDLLAAFPRADGLFHRLIWSRISFQEIEMRFLDSLPARSIDIAVDVGGGCGAYAWVLSRKSRRVFTFEPGEHYGRYLERAVLGSNIHVVKDAVGATCSTVDMYTPGSRTEFQRATLSRGNPIAKGALVRQVSQVTLDSFFVASIVDGGSIDVLKIDVEGYELEVLRGAGKLLARHYPLVFCEIEKRHNPEYSQVFRLLRNAGYRCFNYQGGGFVQFDGDTVDHLQSEDALNVRLSPEYDAGHNHYINNFVFEHPQSRVKVTQHQAPGTRH